MKASELVAQVIDQIAQHGDLEIMLDCDALLTEPALVRLVADDYLPQPLLVIMPANGVGDDADADD
jgi:hypothetical protein